MILMNKFIRRSCKAIILTAAISSQIFGSSGNAEAIISGSDEKRNIIGIEMAEVTPTQSMITGREGVYVSAVIPGHTAYQAGLQAGDIITEINGWAVKDKSTALEVIASLNAGETFPFIIYRRLGNGQVKQFKINILIESVPESTIAKIS